MTKEQLLAQSRDIDIKEGMIFDLVVLISQLKEERDAIIIELSKSFEKKYKEDKVAHAEYSNQTSREFYAKGNEGVMKIIATIQEKEEQLNNLQRNVRRMMRDHEILVRFG